jgi:hypothetical protein
MDLVTISLYGIGAVFTALVLLFVFYAIKNTRRLLGGRGNSMRATGAGCFFLMILAGAAGTFGPLDADLLVLFFWALGLAVMLVGSAIRLRTIQEAQKISAFRVLVTFRDAKLHLGGIIILLLSVPIFLLDMIIPAYDWLSVATVTCFAAAFGLMTSGEKILYEESKKSPTLKRGERRLLRKDLQLLGAHLDLTNVYLASLGVVSGEKPLQMILDQCVEEEPVLLDEYKFVFPRLQFEPLAKNLDRIHPQEKEQAIFRACAKIDSRLLVSYEKLLSPQRTVEVTNNALRDAVKGHGGLLYDYILPQILFKSMLQPVLMKCKRETVALAKERLGSLVRVGPSAMYEGVLELLAAVVAEKKLKTYRKAEPIISALKIDSNGGIDLSDVYRELSPLQPEERINRVITAFATVLRTVYPEIERDLGLKQARETFAKLSSRVFSDFPELYKMMMENLPKETRQKFPRVR